LQQNLPLSEAGLNQLSQDLAFIKPQIKHKIKHRINHERTYM